jgi:hypothetical protein
MHIQILEKAHSPQGWHHEDLYSQNDLTVGNQGTEISQGRSLIYDFLRRPATYPWIWVRAHETKYVLRDCWLYRGYDTVEESICFGM